MMKKIRIEIKWAVIFIAMSLLWMVLERLVGLHDTHIDKHLYLTNLYAIPAIFVFIFALRDKKKKFYAGNMNYAQGFISGLIISILVMLFSPLSQLITSTLITPDYFANAIEYSLSINYHSSVEDAEAYFNLKRYIVQSTIWSLVMGVVTTSIVMIFVRTRKK